MKMTKTLLVAALAAGGLAATAVDAQNSLSRGGGAQAGSARSGSAGGNFGSAGTSRHGGHYNGPTAATGGRHGGGFRGSHGGGYRGYHGGRGYYGYRGYYPAFWGLGIGLWGWPYYSAYWGAPYWDGYYPSSTVVYQQPYPMSVPSQNEFEVSSTEVPPRAEGAPTQAPAYRNYCDSARAYYPKVTRCPEGWRFEPTR